MYFPYGGYRSGTEVYRAFVGTGIYSNSSTICSVAVFIQNTRDTMHCVLHYVDY